MKKLLRYIGLVGIALLLCLGIAYVFLSRFYVVPIMVYHKIEEPATLDAVTPKSFERQMNFIKKNNYNVISFDEYVEGTTQGRKFPKNSIVIHFDDGFLNNYTVAFPVLKKYNFPAMCFIISDFIGNNPVLMNWDQVREMDANGFHIGAHTRRHAYLPSLTKEQAIDEIVGSKQMIEAKLGKPVDYFVYPVGGFNDDIKKIVINAGYKAAGTTNRGRQRFNQDLFELNRIRIKDTDHGIVLWAKLSGYYNIFRSTRKMH